MPYFAWASVLQLLTFMGTHLNKSWILSCFMERRIKKKRWEARWLRASPEDVCLSRWTPGMNVPVSWLLNNVAGEKVVLSKC